MVRTRTAMVWLLGFWGLILPMQSFGAAWILAPQEYDFELFSQYFWNDADFNASGRRVRKPNDGRFEEFREEVKVEAGLPFSTPPAFLRRVNLLFALPVEIAHYQDRNVDLQTVGVEEIRLGVKYCLTCETDFPLVVSTQLTGKFPACDKRAQPPLADCQFDGEVRLLVSRGFWPEPDHLRRSRLYASVEVGYRVRAEEPADEIPYVVELGWYPWSSEQTRFLLKGVIEGVESRAFGGHGAEEDFVKWTLSGRLELGRPLASKDPTRPRHTGGIEVGGGTVFAGKNTGAGQSVFVKLFYNY